MINDIRTSLAIALGTGGLFSLFCLLGITEIECGFYSLVTIPCLVFPTILFCMWILRKDIEDRVIIEQIENHN